MTGAGNSQQVPEESRRESAPRKVTWSAAVPLFVLGFGLFYTVGAVGYEIGTLASPKAGLFPAIVGIFLLGSAGYRLYEEIVRPTPGPDSLGPAWPRVPAICASIGVFIFLLKPAGYLIAATVLTGLLLFFLARRPLWMIAGIAVASAVVSYCFFDLLGVPLPSGLLPF